MTTAPTTDTSAAPPEPGRFAALSPFRYLLITGVIVALVLVVTRSLFLGLPVAHAGTEYRESVERGADAVLAATEALAVGREPVADAAEVSIHEVRGGLRVLEARVRRGDAVVSSARAVGAFTPSPRPAPRSADELPRLAADVVEQLLRDPRLDVHRVRRDTQVVGETLAGLVVLSPGVELRLRDVVLVGALVSEAALTQDPLPGASTSHAPAILVEGLLRLEPMDALPGISVVVPDGVLRTAGAGANVHVEGDVVARSVELRGRGSVFGQIASLDAPVLEGGIREVGRGRAPCPWSEALDMRGGLRTDYFTYLPTVTRWQDVQPMLRFELP